MTYAVAVGFGLLIGIGLWRLDRVLASVFAETAGCPPETASPSVRNTIYLIVSSPIVCLLLAARDGIGIHLFDHAVIAGILLWIASIDWRWRIIPNLIVYPASVAALVVAPIVQAGSVPQRIELTLVGFLVSGGIYLLFFALSILIYHHAGAFGMGDVKLAAFVGLALAYPAAVAAIVFGTLAGAFFAIGWWVASRSRKVGFPYGPAIVCGAILAMLVAPSGPVP